MTGVYTPKPHSGMNPNRGVAGFAMDWMARMAERYTIVEVRCSTEPQPEDEPLHIYKRHQDESRAWQVVVNHLEWQWTMGVLQPGVWTITVPGSDLKHSFEVE